METVARIDLARLRDIGWREWDPIGLSELKEVGGAEVADEYDRYLLAVARHLRRGGSVEEATKYLLTVERDYMGLGVHQGQDARAGTAARSIQSYLAGLDG
ncbi:MAG: hypothetical protein GY873_00235 [Bosea sp.]|uniref:hypothetical protein n=1 Tax=Bosea sp. (in: a-proteobacteria) TaxID=1871050 RepID=UPI00238FC440|nr:hypothetical protein [Bosea sp. (in: a-proteobacteria)]MCP4732598.1 hypothetical protein [Bosea sp. (in: a-proteobacteria)]